MKKLVLTKWIAIIGLVFLAGKQLNAQWIYNTAPIVYTTHFGPGTRVGIGTSSPNSNTTLDVRGMVGVGRQGLGGTYNSTEVQGIWSISPTYLISTTSNNFGTLYGMGYAHTNAGSGAKKPIANFGHQIVFTSNGNVNAAISLDNGHAYFKGNVGIGTTTFDSQNRYKLEVNGSALFYTGAYVKGSNTEGTMISAVNNAPNVPADQDLFWGCYGWDVPQANNPGLLALTSGSNYRFIVKNNGQVGINCNPGNSTYMLTVNGKIQCEELNVVTDVPNADYVFEEDYNLLSLEKVESFITENKHLPDVPSAAEFKENGYSVGTMDEILLRKVEELTLYIIEIKKENEKQQLLIEELRSK
ncbi:MAG: hypothetical protein IPM71_12975 [Bacteroidota bacterium]|nr:MAG: hypothetical protein IPM71_12975 [Bacteroidota bacterium]